MRWNIVLLGFIFSFQFPSFLDISSLKLALGCVTTLDFLNFCSTRVSDHDYSRSISGGKAHADAYRSSDENEHTCYHAETGLRWKARSPCASRYSGTANSNTAIIHILDCASTKNRNDSKSHMGLTLRYLRIVSHQLPLCWWPLVRIFEDLPRIHRVLAKFYRSIVLGALAKYKDSGLVVKNLPFRFTLTYSILHILTKAFD